MGYSLNIIKEFNEAMFDAAFEKNKLLNGIVYRFDFNDGEERAKRIDESYKSKILDNQIEYFWIEYKMGEKQMKLAFFFKDVDANSHHVHVVPGLLEKYTLSDEPPKEKPYADIVELENKKVVIIRNVKAGDYLSFAEYSNNDKGWWCPEDDRIPLTDNRIDENSIATTEFNEEIKKTVKGHEKEFKNYFLEKIRDFEENIFKEKSGGLSNGQRPSERYNPIYWYNIRKGYKTLGSINLTKPIYFDGCGFFTKYNCIDFEKSGGNDIIINCPIVDEFTTEGEFNALFAKYSLTDANPDDVKKAIEEFIGKIKG